MYINKTCEWALFKRLRESTLANPEWSVLNMIVSHIAYEIQTKLIFILCTDQPNFS